MTRRSAKTFPSSPAPNAGGCGTYYPPSTPLKSDEPVKSTSPSRRSIGTRTASIGARRLPAGHRATCQHCSSPETTTGGYTGVRGVLTAATRTVPAWRSWARAWSRCQPVQLDQLVQNLSSFFGPVSPACTWLPAGSSPRAAHSSKAPSLRRSRASALRGDSYVSQQTLLRRRLSESSRSALGQRTSSLQFRCARTTRWRLEREQGQLASRGQSTTDPN